MNIVAESRNLRVKETYDTVVCGGGVAGIAAALASARHGAKTLLIEREYLLGGLATAGLVTIYLPLCDGKGRQVSFGIAEELLRLSMAHGAEARYPKAWLEGGSVEEKCAHRYEVQFNPQLFALDAEALLLKEGVDVLYGTLVSDVIKAGDRITALAAENKSGRYAIGVTKNVVDCTGDADVAYRAGEGCEVFGQGNVLAAWHYYNGKNGYGLRMLGAADVPDKDKKDGKAPETLIERRFTGLDGRELSEMVQLSHAQLLADIEKKQAADESYMPVTMPTIPQIRMTRRIAGVYVQDDGEIRKDYADAVGCFGDWRKRGPAYALPYRCLHGEKVENLLAAGRCISVTDAMWDITRVIPVCAVSGQAAGTAAAMFDGARSADAAKLREALVTDGVKITLSDK